MAKTRSARIEELLDQIADPDTPRYKVEELEKKVRALRKLESEK